MSIVRKLQKVQYVINKIANEPVAIEREALMLGKLLSEQTKAKKNIKSLQDVEFKCFSQWGDDGIIQWLVHNLDIPHKTFVEFGVETYREANTRFLMMNDNWSGLVMDGSPENVAQIINSNYFWGYELHAKSAFIDAENVNELIAAAGFERELGILHIDIDGNDYWVWKAVEVVSPILFISEYASLFGADRAITTVYDKSFQRTKAHYTNIFYGASLKALCQLSHEKGYAFVGCNSNGNNAYFVRRDKLNDQVKEISPEEGYVLVKFRESLGQDGLATHLTGAKRQEAIRGLPVYNVITNQVEPF